MSTSTISLFYLYLRLADHARVLLDIFFLLFPSRPSIFGVHVLPLRIFYALPVLAPGDPAVLPDLVSCETSAPPDLVCASLFAIPLLLFPALSSVLIFYILTLYRQLTLVL